jgi:sugar lactone lactonase YvrE
LGAIHYKVIRLEVFTRLSSLVLTERDPSVLCSRRSACFPSLPSARSSHSSISSARHVKFHTGASCLLANLLAFGALSLPCIAHAQSASLLGFQNNVPTTALDHPNGVAVDANGNIYLADSLNNRVLKETFSAGTYTESTIGSGLDNPFGIALDANGNVYISDSNNSRILKETLSVGTYTQSVVDASIASPMGLAVDGAGSIYVASGSSNRVLKETLSGSTYNRTVIPTSTLNGPLSVSVDGSGDVYIADTNNNRVLKEAYSAGAYTEGTIGSGLESPSGITLDGSANVYIVDSGHDRLLKETYSSGTYSQSIVVSSALNSPSGIAVDGSGVVYIADELNNRVVLESSSADFGATGVGVPGWTVTAIFNFTAAGSSVQPAVVMQGIAAMDYSDAGTGNCTTNGVSHTYSPGDSCTVDLIFKPKYTGIRYGAVQLIHGSGAVISTGYLQGTGIGPELNFAPAQQGALSLPGVTNPYAVAVDGAGNLYIAESVSAYAPGNQVVRESWNGSAWTQTVVATGLAYPSGVAVDGAGNVYIADQDAFTVYKESLSNGAYTQSAVDNSVGTVEAVAVDGSGNVYIASNAYGVLRETPSGGTYTRGTVALSVFGTGLAVDASGNVYVADAAAGNVILKETPGGSSYTQTTVVSSLNQPYGIAIDSFGNILVTESLGTILKETLSAGNYIQTEAANGPGNPVGVAADSMGNIFAVSDENNIVWKVDNFDPPTLDFQATPYQSTSSDSPQTVTLENIGNAALSFPVPGTGNDPAIAQGFTLADNGASDCPVVQAGSSTPGTLAAGSSCQLSVSFVPAAVGANSGSLVLTDNALNQTSPAYATQTIGLSGTGSQATPPIIWSTPAAISYGSALGVGQLNVTSPIAGAVTYSPMSGTVLAAGPHTLTATFTPTDSTDYTTATATVTLTVNAATPSITWANPAAITYGTALGSAQLNASSTLAGSFTYSPSAGTILTAGSHALTATFTPADPTDYSTATATVTITVHQATPQITWSTPAAMIAGTALGSTQLDGLASVTGSFVYTPTAGTIPAVGSTVLSVMFTPTDATDYTTATATVTLPVVNPTPAVGGLSPAVASAGGVAFTLTINGSGFEPNSAAYLGTSPLVTTFVSSTEITAAVPASAIGSAAISNVTVETPSPGGGTSNILQLEVDSAGSGVTPPSFTNTSAAVAPGSSATYAVKLPANSTNISASCLNLPAGATCTYSASAGALTIATAATTAAGTSQITVVFTETVPVAAAGAASLSLLLLPLAFADRRRRRKAVVLATGLVLAFLAVTASLTGCAGGGSSTTPITPTQQVTSSAVVTLTVQ